MQIGGDPAWLKGIDYCPIKLQRITGFLTKMARQPWRLTEDDILALMMVPDAVPGTGSSSLNMTWSKGELVQAILVISTFLSLGNFVLSCGVAPELDMYGGYHVHGFTSCCGIENELDDVIQQQSAFSHHRQQRLTKEEELAVRAAWSATGWYDSQISPRSSKSSDDDDDDDDGQLQEQQSFISDQGAGLGVSMFDSDEEDNSSMINESNHNTLYLDHTATLISKLKSIKSDELHQSLADLKIYSPSDRIEKQVTQQHEQEQENDTLGKYKKRNGRFI